MKKWALFFLLCITGCAAPAMLALNAASFALQTADVVHHWDDGEALADFIGDTHSSNEIAPFFGSAHSSPDSLWQTAPFVGNTQLSVSPNTVRKNPYYCSSPNYADLTCNDK